MGRGFVLALQLFLLVAAVRPLAFLGGEQRFQLSDAGFLARKAIITLIAGAFLRLLDNEEAKMLFAALVHKVLLHLLVENAPVEGLGDGRELLGDKELAAADALHVGLAVEDDLLALVHHRDEHVLDRLLERGLLLRRLGGGEGTDEVLLRHRGVVGARGGGGGGRGGGSHKILLVVVGIGSLREGDFGGDWKAGELIC